MSYETSMYEAKKIRLAIDTTYMDRRPGKGTAIVIRGTVEELLKRRDEFDITLIHKEAIPEDPIYGQCKEIIIPRIPLPKFSGFFSEFFFFLTTKERFDVYYFSYSRLYPTFWLAPAKRIVWAAMDGGPQTAGYGGKAKGKAPWYVRIFFMRISAFVAISEFGKKGIMQVYGLPSDKVPVVYDGLGAAYTSQEKESTTREALRSKYGLTFPYILDVSRFDPHKNIIRLLEAYETLVREDNIPHSLVFVGGRHMPDYSAEVDERIVALHLEDRVMVMPFIDEKDMPAIYREAEFMVFPSLYEGFGLPVIEAMSMGTPVLVSDIEALTEVSGGHAEVVDPYDTDAIVRGMRRLVTDTLYREELSRAGIEQAALFTWKEHGDSLSTVFRKVAIS